MKKINPIRKVQTVVWMKILTKMKTIKKTRMTWMMTGALKASKLYRVRRKNSVARKRSSCHHIKIIRRLSSCNTNNTTTDLDRFNKQQAS